MAHRVIVFEGENASHIMRYWTIYLWNIKGTCFSMKMVKKEEWAEHKNLYNNHTWEKDAQKHG